MQNFITAPHRGSPGVQVPQASSPNAALLIDFDNVTMGIRSDLTRQLKELLNSDIIKGKVAVQRAYADWRRYAQYIVPLSEASVDLIFAPAYGSSKKNATDIRLAIDALELVFTRPEIGTYILLSGDSDFSSLVLKLKEYGKYVIGVGLRESASDLLVQNCDEYFSYSALTGLTRAGEEDMVASVSPWELAERAVNQMAMESDVMRSDRLKQVMLELDPSFDEAQLGYTKFNKFLVEASSKGRLSVRKLENGQYEVQPFDDSTPATAREERPRGRGRRDRHDAPREREAPAPRAGTPRAERGRAPAARPETRADATARTRGGSDVERPAASAASREARNEDLSGGYELLRQAVRALTESGGAARDSDIKRQMLELQPGWDEAAIGFTKFSRFLRQAHDAEVIDLTKSAEGYHEATIGRSGAGRADAAPAEATAPRPRRERGRDRDRGRDRGRRDRAVADAATEPDADSGPEPDIGSAPELSREPEPAPAPAPEPEPAPEPWEEQPAEWAAAGAGASPALDDDDAVDEPAEAGVELDTATATPASEAPAPPAQRPAAFGRRVRRGAPGDGPPPLLPGQVVGGHDGGSRAGAPGSTAVSTPAEPRAETRVAPPVATPDAPEPEAAGEVAAGAGVVEPEPRLRPAPGAGSFQAEEIGLPVDRAAVIRYLSNSYQGVGQKTAEALIEAFGVDRVFNGLHDEPDRVVEVLGGGRRTEGLLNAWQRDYRRRTSSGTGADADAE